MSHEINFNLVCGKMTPKLGLEVAGPKILLVHDPVKLLVSAQISARPLGRSRDCETKPTPNGVGHPGKSTTGKDILKYYLKKSWHIYMFVLMENLQKQRRKKVFFSETI